MRTNVVRGKENMAGQSVEDMVREILMSDHPGMVSVLSELGQRDPGLQAMVEFFQQRGVDGQEAYDAVAGIVRTLPIVGGGEVYNEIVRQVRQRIANEEETLATSSGGQY